MTPHCKFLGASLVRNCLKDLSTKELKLHERYTIKLQDAVNLLNQLFVRLQMSLVKKNIHSLFCKVCICAAKCCQLVFTSRFKCQVNVKCCNLLSYANSKGGIHPKTTFFYYSSLVHRH